MPDFIPTKHALIGWVAESPGPITKVVVLDARKRRDPEDLGPREWRECTHTWGACFGDWLKPGDRTMTPEWVFGEALVFYGFATSDVAEAAIAAFARIEGCEWARAMVPGEPDTAQRPYWRSIPCNSTT